MVRDDVGLSRYNTRFKNNTITEDLAVLSGAYNASAKDSSTILIGAYSPGARMKNCSKMAGKAFPSGDYSMCGLADVEQAAEEDDSLLCKCTVSARYVGTCTYLLHLTRKHEDHLTPSHS